MLKKRGNIWYVALNYKEGGKWKKKWYSTHTSSAREARRIEKDLEYKASEGLLLVKAERDIPTLRQHFDKWLETNIKPPARKPATYENYEYVSRRICAVLGEKKINRITPEDIDEYVRHELTADMSHTFIRLQLRVLKVCLKAAVKWKLISVNPCDAVTPPAPSKSPAKAATFEDVKALLAVAHEEPLPVGEVIIALGALCGLRRGEIAALEWRDVDMDAHVLHIRHSMSRRKNETIEEGTFYKVFPGEKSSLVIDNVKSEESEADIYIPGVAVDALRRMYIYQQRNKLLLGPCYTENGLVCCFEDGRPTEANFIYHEFQRLLKAAGLPHFRVHDLRHTAATLLLTQGVDIKLVSHQLRHADVAITQNIYEHVTDKLAHTSADAMDELFNPKKKQKQA